MHLRLTLFFAVLPLMLTYTAANAQDMLALEQWEDLAPDPDVLFEGKPALAWTHLEENTRIALVGAPADLTPYETFHVHVHVQEPTDSVLSLVFDSDNPETPRLDYYSMTLRTDFSGWRSFRLARRSLRATREPLGWDQIRSVFLSSNWAHQLDPDTVVHLSAMTLDPRPIPGMTPTAGELLLNRSFEVADPGGRLPAGWSAPTFGTQTTVSLDADHARSGDYAVRIQGAPGSNRGGVSVGFGPEDTDPSTPYLMSAWVKTTGTPTASLATAVRFTSVDAEGAVIMSDYRKCAPGPYDWRYHTWLVQLPENTHRFNIVLFHHGEGTAWWDDVSLRRVRLIPATTPALNAAIDDPRPEFRWEAPEDALGTLVIHSALGDHLHEEFAVTGNRFRPRDPLPQGRGYQWYVLLRDDQGGAMTAFVEDDSPVMGTFFAGSWQARIQAKLGDLAPYRELYGRLKPLADSNGMWDPFGLLGDLLDAVNALETQDTLPENMTVDDLLASLDELRLRAPWWQTIFLNDRELFDGLNLDLPGLTRVREAVRAEDYPRARTELREYYRTRTEPSYYRRWEDRPPINPARTTDARADQLLTHKMPIHSYETPTYDLTPEFNWHVFPIIDVEWPTRIHRHFHWSTLAGAYWATNQDKYAQEIALQLLDWAQDNPMERWDRQRYRWAWSTLNATIRIYSSWINAWMRIRSSETWTPDAQFVMLTLLREHGRFLMTHQARTGNWVVAEARGLVELGIMFPEFKEAETWRNEGFRRLRREIDVQVLADGIHVERTPGYHSMTLSCFMEPIKLALLNDLAFEGRNHFLDKFEAMYELYLYGCRPDQRMAQIGDGGNMSAVPLLRRAYDMFGREDMIYVATNGETGQPPVHRSYAFEAGGFYVSRSAWADPNALWSIMDWGGFVGHCHEDMGQICLYAYGAPLLIDSGRYSYARPMRQYFYHTMGHNTVMVNRNTQKRRDPISCRWITCDRFDLVRGLTDNSEPLLHERTLVFKQPAGASPGYWVTLDRLTGTGHHRLDQRWHAQEGLQGQVNGSTVIFTGKPDADDLPSLTLAALPREGLVTAVDEGWGSYQWYRKQPVDVAQFTLETEMPASFVTVLYPSPANAAAPRVRVRAVPVLLDDREANAAQAAAFEVAVGSDEHTVTDLWLFRHGDSGILTAANARLNGRMARVRLGSDSSWMAAEAQSLSYGEKQLFESTSTIDAVARSENQVSASAAESLRLASTVPLTINGGTATAPHDGVVEQSAVRDPVAAHPPKAFTEPRMEIAAPPERPLPTGFAAMLPVETALNGQAITVNATEFSDQGGGAVEPTSRKEGADGRAFLHWDHSGHWLEYTLSVPTPGTYRLYARACTAATAVLRRITVNGDVPNACAAQEFAGTGGYSNSRNDWRIFAVADKNGNAISLRLPAGTATIRLENIDGRSLNLNWLALLPTGN